MLGSSNEDNRTQSRRRHSRRRSRWQDYSSSSKYSEFELSELKSDVSGSQEEDESSESEDEIRRRRRKEKRRREREREYEKERRKQKGKEVEPSTQPYSAQAYDKKAPPSYVRKVEPFAENVAVVR